MSMNIRTRKDFEDLMFSVLNPLIDKYSEECAHLIWESVQLVILLPLLKWKPLQDHFGD